MFTKDTLGVKCPSCGASVQIRYGQKNFRCFRCNEISDSPVRVSPLPKRPPNHIPYCLNCHKEVNPNVVNRTTQGVGVIIPTNFGGLYRPTSTSELVKVCPFCGGRVYSELDAIIREECDRDEARYWTICIGIFIAVVIFLVVIANNSHTN